MPAKKRFINPHSSFILHLSSFIVAVVLIASCAAPAAPAPTTAPKPTAAPAQAATPAAKPTTGAPAPTPKPSADQPQYGGILPAGLWVQPPHLDPHQSQIIATRMPALPAYDTLLEYNPLKQDEIIPDLAERYETSKDGLEYTFYLNKGVKFHDGSPLTSEDVKYSLDRLRNPPTGVLSPRKALLASIDRIETPDANTVKIVTKYSDASFIGALALSHHVIFSRKVVEEKGDMKRTVMGTGPFKFVRWDSGILVEHARNKDYFRKGRPYLDGLMFYIITDPSTWFAAFRTGRILLTSQGGGGLNPTRAAITERELKGKARPLRYVAMSNAFILNNLSKKPLDDVKVRQALNLAVDRPSFIKVAFEGEGMLSTYFMPEPYGKWELPNAEIVKTPGYRSEKAIDIEEAKKLLAQSGHAKDLSLTITARSIHSRAVEVLREQFKAAGIDLKLEVLETGVWQDRKTRLAYELLFDTWGVDSDDPSAWLDSVLSADPSYRDAQIDEWMKAQARTLDLEERKKLVRKIQTSLLEQLPVLPSLKSGTWTLGIWDNVRNYPEPVGLWNSHKYTEVWLAR